MPTWASCRPISADGSRFTGSRAGHGFTLIELLVVLTLIGFLVGITAPRLMNMYDSFQFARERDDLLEAVANLGPSARLQGEGVEIGSAEDLRDSGIEVPSSWDIEIVESWQVRANGSCAPGRLRVSAPGRTVEIDIAAPFCRAELAS